MAVYRRTYASYTGRAHAQLVALVRTLPLCSGRTCSARSFRPRCSSAPFFYPLVCLAMIYLAHNLAFLQQIGAPSQVLVIDNRFFFYFMNVQGVLAFVLSCIRRPRTDLAGPRQRGVASLFLPPALSPRIRFRKSVRPRNPSFADHLDSRTGSLPRASHACRTRMDLGSPLDRRQYHRLVIDLDLCPVSPRDGTLRVGEMADRRRRPAISHALFRSRVRGGN